MKTISVWGLVFAFLISFAVPAASLGAGVAEAASGQTYQVTVGYENASTGALIQAFFPDSLRIHVGDTVRWNIGTHEIHTVTFLAGAPAPDLLIPAPAGSPSPLEFHPVAVTPARPADGLYDGSYFVNSGLLSLDPGLATSFDLTFTKPGTYTYLCLVHGVGMSGEVVVLPADSWVPSPAQTLELANWQLAGEMANLNTAFAKAAALVPAPVVNSDGTTTYHVILGYSTGNIDLVHFFPSYLNVRPGDTVIWNYLAPTDGMSMAPHTVTFLNGTPDPSLTLPGTLFINPLVLFPSAVTNPSQAGQPLTRNGYYNSGLLMPGGSFTLKIGPITGVIGYQCLLHDGSGMTGSLIVQ